MPRTAVILLALAVVTFAGCSQESAKTDVKPSQPEAPKTGAMSGPANVEGKMAKNKELAAAHVDFVKDGVPLIATHCSACHSGAQAKGGLDLSAIKTKEEAEAMKEKLAKAADLVESRRMPPRNAPQPSKEDQGKLVAALRSL